MMSPHRQANVGARSDDGSDGPHFRESLACRVEVAIQKRTHRERAEQGGPNTVLKRQIRVVNSLSSRLGNPLS